MDFRSHGMSERPANGDLTLRAMGRDVAAVLDATTPDRPAIVVGHSMGAMAVLALAEQRPELFGPRIAGIVLIGAASSDLLRGAMGSVTGLLRPRFGSIQAAALRVDRVRKAVLSSPVDLGGMVTRLTQFGPDTPKPVVDHVVGLARRTPSEVWTDTLPELMEMDLRHAVPRVRVPALVLVGDDDRVTPPAAAVSLAAALPQGRLVVLEEAGHIPMLEQPERLVRELGAFVPTVFGPAAPQAPPPRGRRGRRVSPANARRGRGRGGRLHALPPVRDAHPGRLRGRRPGRGPAVHRGGARPARGQAGGAVRRRRGAAAHEDARRDRTPARGRVHRERPAVPAARQPRPAPRRDRVVHALARRDDLDRAARG